MHCMDAIQSYSFPVVKTSGGVFSCPACGVFATLPSENRHTFYSLPGMTAICAEGKNLFLIPPGRGVSHGGPLLPVLTLFWPFFCFTGHWIVQEGLFIPCNLSFAELRCHILCRRRQGRRCERCDMVWSRCEFRGQGCVQFSVRQPGPRIQVRSLEYLRRFHPIIPGKRQLFLGNS